MTDAAVTFPGAHGRLGDTLVCEGDACAVVGAGSGTVAAQAVAGLAVEGLDTLLRKQISDHGDRAGADLPQAG